MDFFKIMQARRLPKNKDEFEEEANSLSYFHFITMQSFHLKCIVTDNLAQ